MIRTKLPRARRSAHSTSHHIQASRMSAEPNSSDTQVPISSHRRIAPSHRPKQMGQERSPELIIAQPRQGRLPSAMSSMVGSCRSAEAVRETAGLLDKQVDRLGVGVAHASCGGVGQHLLSPVPQGFARGGRLRGSYVTDRFNCAALIIAVALAERSLRGPDSHPILRGCRSGGRRRPCRHTTLIGVVLVEARGLGDVEEVHR
jgi:hypothetical protein